MVDWLDSCKSYLKKDPKIVWILCFKFLITLTFWILQTTKDTLVVMNTEGGAEVIPVLKGGPVVISTFFIAILYAKLSDIFSKKTLFQSILFCFLSFYFCYAFLLLPNQEFLTPHESADWLLSVLGQNHAHFVFIYKYWIASLFFVITELWSMTVLVLCFWIFANQIYSFEEAKKSYIVILVAGHLGLIFSGPVVWLCMKFNSVSFESFVKVILLLVCFLIIASMVLYQVVSKKFCGEAEANDIKTLIKDENKTSFFHAIIRIVKNPCLVSLAVMIIGFAFCANMLEVLWKAYLKTQCADAQKYQSILSIMVSSSGFLCLLFSIFMISRSMLEKMGWYFGAQLTPIVLSVVGICFCFSYFLDTIFSVPAVVIVIGAAYGVCCKVMKLSIFDPTKEMVYIPMDEESKTKGKAAMDIVAFRFGKSAASWVQLFLIEVVGGSFLNAFYPIMIFVGVVVFFWMKSIKSVDKILKNELL